MKRLLTLLIPLLAMLFSSAAAQASMRPPVGPMNIEGVIETIAWAPDTFIKAKGIWRNGQWHPASGTLGRDRTRRAHYRITLVDAKVESLPGANHSRSFRSGAAITVFIAHPADDGSLKKGMRIKISDYTVRGDEGGDRYSFSAVTIKDRHKTLYPARYP
ncbi:hypothetical protein EST62_12590 [Chlorobaculum sp. 24CR]|uniref:hypothetical protein n=1 Tax=Chlorobaculum sp. 24CR TaxID=2508878 RepID=UPI00100B4D57|nr:hypothetical protein [Chlorobaculum sp. 24CR]RXK80674.1 hypothetical protein EST62_12590 [Chlorobaculum sp. 24CR]